jgi:AcrR family transcriptional regulator
MHPLLDSVNHIRQDRCMTDDSTPGEARDRLVAAARAELIERGLAGVSLRGIARRAEVSHAAPKYFFGDRAGLLTAIATQGFAELTERLRAVVTEGAPGLGDLGRAYVHFGLEHPALFELMFRPDELHTDDPALQRAQAESIGVLATATTSIDVGAGRPDGMPPVMALVSWAFAHGLVALVRDGALQSLGGGADATALADQLVGVFDRVVR